MKLTFRSFRSPTWAAAMLSIALTSAALGDSVVARSSASAKPFPYTDVKVVKVSGGQIFFTTSGSGATVARDLKLVDQIKLDDEPNLNAAEDAYAAGQWDAASDAYQKVLTTTDKDWLKDWCTLRLVLAAGKAHRFDAATVGYVQLVLKDPASAADFRPDIPEGTTYLDTAAATVESALKTVDGDKSKEAQQQALLSFLLAIEQARHDSKAASDVAERLMKFNASASNGDANSIKVLVESRLAVARADVQDKKYDDAIALVKQSGPNILDPMQQAEALFIIAQAKDGLAADKNDPDALKDVALAYMRVVADFKDQSQNPLIPQALLRTAAILEILKETSDAVRLYTQITTAYKNSPAGVEAQKALDRIGPAPKP